MYYVITYYVGILLVGLIFRHFVKHFIHTCDKILEICVKFVMCLVG
jgi:hypothetical protein